MCTKLFYEGILRVFLLEHAAAELLNLVDLKL
jgi:hypothetical protein